MTVKIKEMLKETTKLMKQQGQSREELNEYLSSKLGYPVSRHAIQCWFKQSRPDMVPSLSEFFCILEFIDAKIVAKKEGQVIEKFRLLAKQMAMIN